MVEGINNLTLMTVRLYDDVFHLFFTLPIPYFLVFVTYYLKKDQNFHVKKLIKDLPGCQISFTYSCTKSRMVSDRLT